MMRFLKREQALVLPVDPLPFLQTLRRLGYLTQDDRFIELHRDLMLSALIDSATGTWSLFGTEPTRLLPERLSRFPGAEPSRRKVLGCPAQNVADHRIRGTG
jgi:hypothetical protein